MSDCLFVGSFISHLLPGDVDHNPLVEVDRVRRVYAGPGQRGGQETAGFIRRCYPVYVGLREYQNFRS